MVGAFLMTEFRKEEPMAGSRIKGITVEIGGDTTKLQTSLKAIEITVPPILLDNKVNETRIMPKAEARFFEIQYIYEAECIQRNFSTTNALVLILYQ